MLQNYFIGHVFFLIFLFIYFRVKKDLSWLNIHFRSLPPSSFPLCLLPLETLFFAFCLASSSKVSLWMSLSVQPFSLSTLLLPFAPSSTSCSFHSRRSPWQPHMPWSFHYRPYTDGVQPRAPAQGPSPAAFAASFKHPVVCWIVSPSTHGPDTENSVPWAHRICLPHGGRVHLAQQVSLTSSLATLQAGDAPRFCEDDHPS